MLMDLTLVFKFAGFRLLDIASERTEPTSCIVVVAECMRRRELGERFTERPQKVSQRRHLVYFFGLLIKLVLYFILKFEQWKLGTSPFFPTK